MHHTQNNLIEIQDKIKSKIKKLQLFEYNPKIIAVSKTFQEQDILPLLKFEHCDFGENKVQEAINKWTELKKKYEKVKLHMLGKLQTNKVKFAVEIFDYIHSLDNLKLANKLANEISKKEKKIKIFIQINLEGEKQKSGIEPSELELFYKNCCQLKLNIIGTMCIPPESKDPSPYFKKLLELNQKIGLREISMGMTNDYLKALEYKSTFLRIGTGIFGKRTN
ncbi:MAG: YggS family pyridoxal phosphate enzyme [Pelagibacteraceae bacterium TMED201]|nr:YggS family pyridoxal phosphate-dependent enzyme [Pelagibacterales bacterium SAG-MED30]OUW63317.1 MAG: YggS family pyridoxal phosphate enzyme [Pelagibacteraceae bacterium TMED201]|tara:strand:+ start:243 stop:908 length:666 start_codon:yes stop_codon:yes gene_type:complete